jgi:hypothetical protein
VAFRRAADAAVAGSALDPGAARTALQEVSDRIAATLPAPGSSPAAVYGWWLRLGPAEQRMLVRDQPRLVGGLDGVPAAARDAANRVLLASLPRRARPRRRFRLRALALPGPGRPLAGGGGPDRQRPDVIASLRTERISCLRQ